METRRDRRSRQTGASTRDLAGITVIALACPLLCMGPLLLAGLTSTGLARMLRGAPWPLVAVVVLVVVALGIWGVRARRGCGAHDCCTPLPTRPWGDGTTR